MSNDVELRTAPHTAPPAPRSKKISTEARAVLSLCEVQGNTVFIRCGRLDRKLYGEVNDVLMGIGGKWNRLKMEFDEATKKNGLALAYIGGYMFAIGRYGDQEVAVNVVDTLDGDNFFCMVSLNDHMFDDTEWEPCPLESDLPPLQ